MFIKRDNKGDCIIAGYVVCDQKQKDYNGKPYIEFGIGMGKDEHGENLPIVNITVWERTVPVIYKGDRVLAAGKLKIAEKGENKYYSMNADFCIKEIVSNAGECEQKPKIAHVEPLQIDDEDLPF